MKEVKYPKVGDRIMFSYHGKQRVGTVETKNGSNFTLNHFDTDTGRDYSSFTYKKIDGRGTVKAGISKI